VGSLDQRTADSPDSLSALDRINGINAQLEILDDQIEQATSEASMLGHIDDDAQRDAAVSDGYEDRGAAKMTHSDVTRMTKHIQGLERDRAKLVSKRDRSIRKLASQ